MPPSLTTPRIPPTEWEQRRVRIVNLYINQDLTLLGDNGVIETMKREGFSATKSQYETQLRGWGVRKNMTSEEWSEYFSRNQESQQGGETRELCLSGKKFSTSRIKTAQRRHGRREKQATKKVASGSRHASLGSTLLPILTLEGRPTPSEQDASRSAHSQPLEPVREVDISAIEVVDISNVNADTLYPNHSIRSTPQFQANNSLNFITNVVSDNALNDGDFRGLDLPLNDLTDINMETPRSFDFDQHIFDIQSDTERTLVPSSSTPNQVNLTGIESQRGIGINTLPSIEIVRMICQDISNNNIPISAYGSGPNIAHYNIIWQFMADITTPNSSIRRPKFSKEYPSIDTFLPQIFTNLISDDPFLGEIEGQFSMLSCDNAIEWRFLSRLIMSLTNGYAGLENIPPGGILRFLTKRHDIQSSLFQYLQSNHSFAARSLAENCFQAALESDDVSVAKFLLTLSYIDKHDTICLVNGERCTPLEKAALIGSFGIMKLLLDLEVDVNRIFSENNGMIDLMLSQYDPKSTLSPEFLSLIHGMWKAGATIHMEDLRSAISEFFDSQLAYMLIQVVNFQTLQDLVNDDGRGCIRDIVRNFEKSDAISLLEHIMERFQEYDGRCFNQLDRGLEEAFDVAAEKGYMEIVQLLLPYVKCFTRSFEMAVKNKNQELIDLIFAKPSSPKDLVNGKTLIAALASGNQKAICFLKDNNVLDGNLDDNDFGTILQVAIDTGNVTYAYKIIDSRPRSRPGIYAGEALSRSLASAIANDHDDLARMLLSLGVVVYNGISSRRNDLSPLCIAIRKRKFDIVREMIEGDIIYTTSIYGGDHGVEIKASAIVDIVVQCDDNSIVQEIFTQNSQVTDLRLTPSQLERVIEKRGLGLFWNLLKLGRKSQYTSDAAFIVAIEREDISLLNDIFDFGMLPAFDYLGSIFPLGKCSMLKALLNQMRESQLQEYGPYLLACAIRLYPTSSEALDILLSHNLGDINTYPRQFQSLKMSRPKFSSVPLIRIAPPSNPRTPLGDAIRGIPARHKMGYCDLQLVGRILDVFGNANSITTFSFNGGGSQTALMDAIETKSGEMVRLLLRHGAEVNEPARFSLKRTPLQKAVEVGSLEIIRLLLSKGADVNALPAARGGGTAL